MKSTAKVVIPTEGGQERESAEQQSIEHLKIKQKKAMQCIAIHWGCTEPLSWAWEGTGDIRVLGHFSVSLVSPTRGVSPSAEEKLLVSFLKRVCHGSIPEECAQQLPAHPFLSLQRVLRKSVGAAFSTFVVKVAAVKRQLCFALLHTPKMELPMNCECVCSTFYSCYMFAKLQGRNPTWSQLNTSKIP